MHSPDPLAGIGGTVSKGKGRQGKGRNRKGRDRKGRGEEGKGEGGEREGREGNEGKGGYYPQKKILAMGLCPQRARHYHVRCSKY